MASTAGLGCPKRGHKSQGYTIDAKKEGIQGPCCQDWIIPESYRKMSFKNLIDRILAFFNLNHSEEKSKGIWIEDINLNDRP